MTEVERLFSCLSIRVHYIYLLIQSDHTIIGGVTLIIKIELMFVASS